MATDDEIKEVVRRYILSGHESDNADCLHEQDELDTYDSLQRAYHFYRSAIVTVSWE